MIERTSKYIGIAVFSSSYHLYITKYTETLEQVNDGGRFTKNIELYTIFLST